MYIPIRDPSVQCVWLIPLKQGGVSGNFPHHEAPRTDLSASQSYDTMWL